MDDRTPENATDQATESVADSAPDAPATAAESATISKTTLNKTWFFKVLIMTLLCFGFGTWGLYDAVSAYPKIGERYAEYMEYDYLRLAERVVETGEDRFMFEVDKLSEQFPQVKLENLDANIDQIHADARNEDSDRYVRAQMDEAQYKWLVGLTRVGALDPSRTTYVEDEASDRNPGNRLRELSGIWSQAEPPRPLEVYDLPLQWAIMVVSYGFTLYLLSLFVRVSLKSYQWDPVARRLYLPGERPAAVGSESADAGLVPDDIDEVDKRKWSKFLVSLRIREDHPRHPGAEMHFDLYRYAKLEDWILEMEAEAFGDEDDEDQLGEAGSESEPAEPAAQGS